MGFPLERESNIKMLQPNSSLTKMFKVEVKEEEQPPSPSLSAQQQLEKLVGEACADAKTKETAGVINTEPPVKKKARLGTVESREQNKGKESV